MSKFRPPQDIQFEDICDQLGEKIRQLFAVSDCSLSVEQKMDAYIWNLAKDFAGDKVSSQETDFESLANGFKNSQIPLEPSDVGQYMEYLMEEIVPHSINVSSPRCMGNMTSSLPYFMKSLAKLLTCMNQNMVKTESSKVFTPYERQVLAMVHRLVYSLPEEFYDRIIQQCGKTLGVILSGGTQANIMALWCARNAALKPDNGFSGIGAEGLATALSFYGYKGAVVIGSSLMHYSFEKAADLLGIGSNQLLRIPVIRDNHIDLKAVQDTINECRRRRLCVIALVGVAGSTDIGSIDPLQNMADIAHTANIHFHVDAAWGGGLLFSEKYRPRLRGIECADSVTIDGHKQLHLPIGVGMLLLRDPQLAQIISRQAHYILRQGSADLGKYTLEGSRPSLSLFLHAALCIIGRKGYSWIIEESMSMAKYMANTIRDSSEFELLFEPETNILNYRYLGPAFKERSVRGQLTQSDQERINQTNEHLHKAQRRAGNSLVSRTILVTTNYGQGVPIVSLRAVLGNPVITKTDIDAVLEDQIQIAAQLPELQV